MEPQDRLSSTGMEAGGIITPTAPSVAAYSFVPSFPLSDNVIRDTRSPTLPRGLEINTAPSKSPRRFDSESFYSSLQHFPIKIKQMTYSSDDITAPRKLHADDTKQTMIHTARSETNERFNKDIARQVDHWMRHKPISDGFMCSITPRVSYSPTNGRPLPRERERRKRYKRHRGNDNEDRLPHDASITSQDSDISNSQDLLRNTLRRRRHKADPDNRYTRFGVNSHVFSDAKRGEIDKRSVFGSVHNEIEFQKRYRRMFDLNKHLQFVNSTNGLKGQKIASKKLHHLPPMAQKQCERLERSQMFAIETVTKTNDPDDNEMSITPRTILKDVTLSNPSRTSNVDSTYDKTVSNLSKISTTIAKSEIGKFDKLPKISSNSDKHLITNTQSDISALKLSFDKDYEEMKSEIGDAPAQSRCSTRVTEVNDARDSKNRRTPESKSKFYADDELSEYSSDEGYAEIQEMKVTISIKYKPESEKSAKRSKSKSKVQTSSHKSRGRSGGDFKVLDADDNNLLTQSAPNFNKTGAENNGCFNISPYDKMKNLSISGSPAIDNETYDTRFLAE